MSNNGNETDTECGCVEVDRLSSRDLTGHRYDSVRCLRCVACCSRTSDLLERAGARDSTEREGEYNGCSRASGVGDLCAIEDQPRHWPRSRKRTLMLSVFDDVVRVTLQWTVPPLVGKVLGINSSPLFKLKSCEGGSVRILRS